MIQFFQSVMGKRFYEGTMPALVDQLKKLNENIEKSFDQERPSDDDLMTPEQLSNSGTREDALESALRLVLKDVFEAEVAGHVSYEHLNVAVELSNFQEEYPNIMVREVWEDDRIQFARLLCEIVATQAEMIGNPNALEESMDLPMKRINELFDRAHKVWEASKLALWPPGES